MKSKVRSGKFTIKKQEVIILASLVLLFGAGGVTLIVDQINHNKSTNTSEQLISESAVASKLSSSGATVATTEKQSDSTDTSKASTEPGTATENTVTNTQTTSGAYIGTDQVHKDLVVYTDPSSVSLSATVGQGAQGTVVLDLHSNNIITSLQFKNYNASKIQVTETAGNRSSGFVILGVSYIGDTSTPSSGSTTLTIVVVDGQGYSKEVNVPVTWSVQSLPEPVLSPM